jgi:hypothetical protein
MFQSVSVTTRCHRWRDPQLLMLADKIVIHHVELTLMGVVFELLENDFVSRVNRRMYIRMVRLFLSAYEVLMCFGSFPRSSGVGSRSSICPLATSTMNLAT